MSESAEEEPSNGNYVWRWRDGSHCQDHGLSSGSPLTSQLMPSIYQTHPASESGDGCVDAQKDRQGWDMDLEIAAHALVNEQVTEQLWFLLISPGVLLNLLPALGVGTKN